MSEKPEGFEPVASFAAPLPPTTTAATTTQAEKPAPKTRATRILPSDQQIREHEDTIPGVMGTAIRGMRAGSDVAAAGADMLIPKTLQDAAFMAGSALAGPARLVPLVAKLPLSLMRVILGAVSEGTETALEGKGFSTGMASGAVSGTVGEAAGGLARGGVKAGATLKNKLLSSGPSEAASKAVGQFAAAKVPPMASAAGGTPQLEQAVLGKDTRRKLGEYWDNRLSDVEKIIGPETTIRVPSLTPAEIQTQYGPMPAALLKSSGGDRITIREAADQLKELRLQAYSGAKNDPTTRGMAGADARKKYGDALREIDAELKSFNPQAADLWNDGRHAYAVGSALLSTLQKAGIGSKPGEPIDLNRLRAVVSRQRGQLQERMGKEDFKALVDLVFHGGATQTKAPMFRPALPERVDYPVDLPQIMMNSVVNRLLP